jgi:hypothetical protein
MPHPPSSRTHERCRRPLSRVRPARLRRNFPARPGNSSRRRHPSAIRTVQKSRVLIGIIVAIRMVDRARNAPVEPQGLATSSQPRNGPLGPITRRAAVDGQPQAPMARQRGCPSKILQRLTLLACNFCGQSPSRTLMPLATSGAGPAAATRAPGEVRAARKTSQPSPQAD